MKKIIKILLTYLLFLNVFFMKAQLVSGETKFVDEIKLASTDISRVKAEAYTLEVEKEYEIISDNYSTNNGIQNHYVSFIAPELEDDEEFHLIFHYDCCYALVDIFDSQMNQIGSDLGDRSGFAYHYNLDVDLRKDLKKELVPGERYYIKLETFSNNADNAHMKLIRFTDYPEHALTCNQDYMQKLLYAMEEYTFVAPVTAMYEVNVDFSLIYSSQGLYYEFLDSKENGVMCYSCFMNEGYITNDAMVHSYQLKAGETYRLVLGRVDASYSGAGTYSQDVTLCISTNAEIPEIPVTPEVPQFSDVRDDDWFASSVKKIAAMGLMTGTSETTFAPNSNMSRAMMVTTLYRLAGKPDVTNPMASTKFSDVESGAWYEDSVNWAYQTGITTGYTDNDGNATRFGSDDTVTREQLAVFLHRFAVKQGYNVKVSAKLNSYVGYSDISEYALEAMEWAVGTGLISGIEYKENGVTRYDLAPKGSTTRAQLATILVRFCEYYKE